MVSDKLTRILSNERNRQENELEMIASENYVSNDVLHAYANVFTNKYSEGYPWARYYGWQINVDELERYTQKLALQVFGLWKENPFEKPESTALENIFQDVHTTNAFDTFTQTWGVNVQPLSGSPANLAVYMWVLKPWDAVLAMSLNAGWHLSHGHPLNSSAIYYNFIPYGVKPETFQIDYDELRSKALEEKPAMIVAWFSAYPKNIDWQNFAAIADEVSNIHGYRPLLMADISHIAGLIAGEVLSSPFPYFDIITTTTHKTLRGPRGAMIYMRRWRRNVEWEYNIWVDFLQWWKMSVEQKDLEKSINRGVFPWLQWWPHVHEMYAKAVALEEVLQPTFKSYAKKVVQNAKLLADYLRAFGWDVLSDTTENHMILIDVTRKRVPAAGWEPTPLTGKIAEQTLEKVGISINKNLLPFDQRTPMDPSWVRIGTPAITSRWLWEAEMKHIASIISRAWENYGDENILSTLLLEVQELCKKFPLWYV